MIVKKIAVKRQLPDEEYFALSFLLTFQLLSFRQTVSMTSSSVLRALKTLPVYIEEDHHEVLPHIFKNIGQYLS